MKEDEGRTLEIGRLKKGRNKVLKRIVSNGTWISAVAAMVLYLTSAALVILGIVKLYVIGADLFISENFFREIDLVQLLAQFIGILEVYLLAIIFKIFAVGIFSINVEEIVDYKGERLTSIEELKCELAKAIVLFLAVFLVQKVVLWNDGTQLLYYGVVITMICAILIAFTVVLQRNIRKTKNDEALRAHQMAPGIDIIPRSKIDNGEVAKRSARRFRRNRKPIEEQTP